MKQKRVPSVVLLALFLLQGAALGESHKDQYTLFNPTPRDQMREFSSDQTTFTLTPYTVDAGHFQAEVDFIDYVHDRREVTGGHVRTEGWIYGWSTYRLGLCNRSDLEVSIRAYSDITTTDTSAGTRSRDTGFGNVTLASKINLWGNDGGKTAMAVLPFVTFPTARGNNDYSGGFRVPFVVKLSQDTDLGLMTGVTLYENADNVHAAFMNSASVRVKLPRQFLASAEIVSSLSGQNGSWGVFGNTALAYQMTRDLQFHAGITFNIHNTEDLNPFLGFTWRL